MVAVHNRKPKQFHLLFNIFLSLNWTSILSFPFNPSSFQLFEKSDQVNSILEMDNYLG